MLKRIGVGLYLGFCVSTAWTWVLNNPYPPSQSQEKIYYSSFPEQPKTLDPAQSYNSNEALFLEQIVEPVLAYHYFKRPYTLTPLVAQTMPEVSYWNEDHQAIQDPLKEPVAYTVYRIHLLEGVKYQPHPAFARCGGKPCYEKLNPSRLSALHIHTLQDFKNTGTRTLLADDFIYQIKRLADPHINSPIYGLMAEYILGFKSLNRALAKAPKQAWRDLRDYPLEGVKKIDDLTFEIHIKGQYRPFLFWLAMPFFSPAPWEVDAFYAQPGMQLLNIGWNWNPVGTGPFMLSENNPNRRMVLERNPNYRPDFFPSDGSERDKAAGYLKHAGERLPLIDKAIFTLEKEAIPRWNKFLQGYYDASGIASDSFDQAIHINRFGQEELTPEMKEKQIRLIQTIEPAVFYFGFNMLDPIVGGNSERARLLRLAISLAINTEERIALFYNGRGKAAQSPIPIGIFGHQPGEAGMNHLLYQKEGKHVVRKRLKLAKQWMRQAGYANGIDPQTQRPLLLHYDVSASGGPDEKAELEWMRKQFAKLGIALNIRSTQYNRFQEKMRTGGAQIFSWGWKADYPDPENFLFLLYGPNGKVHHGGENASNYANETFDRYFQEMKNRDNDLERLKLISEMVQLLQHDAPWVWGLYSKTLTLSQPWMSPLKPNTMMAGTLKYVSVDVEMRNRLREAWNQMILWPLWLGGGMGLAFLLPVVWVHRRKEKRVAPRF